MSNSNDYQQQRLRGLKRKYEAVQSRGGKCERCGYNANLAALDFHHREPSSKRFQIDMRTLPNTNLNVLKEELDKCDLLCANCHREEHHQDLAMDKVENIIRDCDKSSFSSEIGSVCPVCGNKFPKSKGKIYCSKECRESSKGYPTLQELEEQYTILKSWEKVAQHFNITRKITQRIRKKGL